jgi:hypothetical protein
MIGWVPTWFESEDITYKVDISTDNTVGEMIKGTKISGYKMISEDANSDIIITDKAETIEGYKKYENMLYSPLVLFTVQDVADYSDGFIKVPTSSTAFRVDLYTILTAIENGKNWEDIGVNKNVVNGAVTLYIPNEMNSYYSKVVDLFYMTFNNGEMPSEERRAELEKKVNNVLSKCHKIPDITQGVYEEKENNTKEGKVFIGPEYLYKRGSNSSMGTGYDDSYRPVHFIKTVFIYSDIFVKEVNTEVEDEKVKDFASKLIDKMKKDSDFFDKTGWRIKNSTFELGYVYVKDPQ